MRDLGSVSVYVPPSELLGWEMGWGMGIDGLEVGKG